MPFYSDDHEIENAVLTATNEGSLYQRHRALAEAKAEISVWHAHVAYNVRLLRFVKLDTPMQVRRTAECLRDYYTRHVAEG